jgi:adenylosuccinate lyase
LVEIEYFIALCNSLTTRGVKTSLFDSYATFIKNFSTEDALWIKETEKVTIMM